MAALRTDKDILKGSALMLFVNGAPIGFATSHSLSINTNTTSISTKDHGDFPSTIPQNITWEVTAENLYSTAGEAIYMQLQVNMKAVTIVFAQASNYQNTGVQEGLPMLPTGIQGAQGPQEWGVGNKIAEGEALITSYSINAPAGDNATMSVTFTGTGQLTMYNANTGTKLTPSNQ